MKTFQLKPKDIVKKWYIIDAEKIVLGRLSTEVASILRGKNKPAFTPHLDCGDNVIVLNVAKVAFNGDMKAKMYHRYSGYPGGLRSTNLEDMLKNYPERVIMSAVKGMLPKNKLGRQLLTNLRVYKDEVHEHAAQTPEKIEIKG
ncbi:MAG: 50S ribosomal protein L13 [Spirochaetes bacterium]|nr:50S ribosomal protein L13 [Spirochaetota bacterium]